MERRALDEEIDLSIEDILVSLETIATMNEAELRQYQNELFGQLKEVLMAAGVPEQDLEDILDLSDEELLAWMDQLGIDAGGMFGDQDQFDFGEMEWGFGDIF